MKFQHVIIIIIFGLLNHTNATHAQTFIQYLKYTNLGEYYYYKNNYTKAIDAYKHALKFNSSPVIKDMLILSKCFLQSNNQTDAISTMDAALKGNIAGIFQNIESDSIFEFYRKGNSTLDLYLNKFSENYKILNSEFDHKTRHLYDTIEIICSIDQILNHKRLTGNFNFVEDSLFYENYLSFIEKNGYLGYYSAGTDLLHTVSLHIHDGQQYNRFKSIMYTNLNNGVMLPWEYAHIVDRVEYAGQKICGMGTTYTLPYCYLPMQWKSMVRLCIESGISPFFKEPRRYSNPSYIKYPLFEYLETSINDFYGFDFY